MTPCEENGYKVGQIFKVIHGGSTFGDGSLVALSDDDGTESPKFDLIEGKCACHIGVHTNAGAYLHLEFVERVYPPVEQKRETVSLAGKTYYKDEVELAIANIRDELELALANIRPID